jgi:phage tail-like protein
MAVGDRTDPYRAYNYRIEIDNTPVAGFSEANIPDGDVEPAEYREGTDPMWPRKLSGLRKFSNITLKRGYTESDDLYRWYVTALSGSVERRNGAIILQDEDRNEVLRWNFSEGWPCKYMGAAMNASSNDMAIESIEICVESVFVEFLGV